METDNNVCGGKGGTIIKSILAELDKGISADQYGLEQLSNATETDIKVENLWPDTEKFLKIIIGDLCNVMMNGNLLFDHWYRDVSWVSEDGSQAIVRLCNQELDPLWGKLNHRYIDVTTRPIWGEMNLFPYGEKFSLCYPNTEAGSAKVIDTDLNVIYPNEEYAGLNLISVDRGFIAIEREYEVNKYDYNILFPNGELASPNCWFEDYEMIEGSSILVVEKSKKYGVIGWGQCIEPLYDEIIDEGDDRVSVCKEGVWGYLRIDGTFVEKCVFEEEGCEILLWGFQA